MKNWLKILLSQNSLRKFFGTKLFFSALEYNHHIEIKNDLAYKNVLVLAPHIDDDSLACGGTLAKLSKSGAKITVVYFTDGAGGRPELRIKNEELKMGQDELVRTRKEEAKKSSDILGLSEQVFLNYRDGQVGVSVAGVKAINSLIDRVEPDIIFLPSFLDNHPDHRGVNDIFEQAANQKITAEIWAYEVWTPLFANRIVVINSEIETKKMAIGAHQSQLAARAYDKAILGLNQYRAEINSVAGFAEGFFATKAKIYQALIRKNNK